MIRDQYIDVYHGQNENTIKATKKNINWEEVARDNPEICVLGCKVQEGRFIDPQFEYNREGFKYFDLGIMYIWPRPEAHGLGSIEDQVNLFVRTVGALRPNEVIMLDCEAATKKDKNGKVVPILPVLVTDEAIEMANRLEQIYGVDVTMYFGKYFQSFWNSYKRTLHDGRRPWILPSYGKNDGTLTDARLSTLLQSVLPVVPAVVQYTSTTYLVQGISGNVDRNVVLDMGALYKCTINHDVPVVPEVPVEVTPPVSFPPVVIHSTPILPKDPDMAKIVQVEGDNAIFAVTGNLACWVSSEAEFNALNTMGQIPTWAERQTIHKEDLKCYVLVSAAPSYADDWAGTKTAAGDFRDTA